MSDQDPDSDYNITDPIFAWAERAPHVVAIIEQGRVISYAALCNAVRHAMQRFREAGWKSGDVIGIAIRGETSLHLVVSLALARSGLTQVTLPSSELASRRLSVAQTLGVRAIVTNHESDRLVSVPRLVLEANWLSAACAAAVSPDIRGSGGDKAWIVIQTSGTTGTSKNIDISHRTNRLRARRYKKVLSCLPGERTMSMVGLQFWAGIFAAVRCLSDGGAIVALPETFSAAQLLNWIDLHHVTYLSCAPVHIHWLLQELQSDAPILPGLRILQSVSAALVPSLLQDAKMRLSLNIFIHYGSNETGVMAVAVPEVLDRFPDSVGQILPGVEFEIVDQENHPVSAGTVGRVRVRGGGMQYSRDEATGRDGWHYPGDMAMQNEAGIVFLKGRYDEIMNFEGLLISPTEIESALAQHPLVAEVVAFPLSSPQHQDVPAVAVVLKQPVSMDELNRYCVEHLGIRAPKIFIVVDQMPRNAMGKVLRPRLTQIALERLSAK